MSYNFLFKKAFEGQENTSYQVQNFIDDKVLTSIDFLGNQYSIEMQKFSYANLSSVNFSYLRNDFLSFIKHCKDLNEVFNSLYPHLSSENVEIFKDLSDKLLINLDSFFPTTQELSEHVQNVGKDKVFEQFKLFLFLLKKMRDSVIHASDDLDNYIESTQGMKFEPLSTVTIEGVPVIINNVRLDNQVYFDEEFIRDCLDHIRQAIIRINRAGFKKQLNKFKIVLNLFKAGQGVAGSFSPNPSQHIIDLYANAPEHLHDLEYTIVHEFGHKYYFLDMPSNARKYWEERLSHLQPTNENKVILKTLILEYLGEKNISTKSLESLCMKYVLTPDKDQQTPEFKRLSVEIEKMKDGLRSNLADYLTRNSLSNLDKFKIEQMINNYPRSVNLLLPEPITPYATTNSKETFAEAFAFYVNIGPRALQDKTRSFFKDLIETGGVSLKYASKSQIRKNKLRQLLIK